MAIIDAFKEVDWAQTGKDILDGIGGGIMDAVGGLVDKAKDAAKAALDGVKNFLGIESPSKVMRDEVGLMMGEGVAEGLLESSNHIEDAFGQVTRDIALDADYYGSGSNSSVYNYTNDYSRSLKTDVNVSGGTDELEWERKTRRMIREQVAEMMR